MAKRRRGHDYGRSVQIAAIMGFVTMVAIDSADGPNINIEAWLYGGMLGIAVGAKPEDIANFFRKR